MRSVGLFWRLLAAIGLPALAASGAMTAAAALVLEGGALSRLESDLKTQARLMGATIAASAPAFAGSEPCGAWGDTDGVYLTLISADGHLICEAPSLLAPGTDMRDRPEVAAALRGEALTDRRRHLLIDQEMLFVAAPVVREGRTVAVVRAGAGLNPLRESLAALYRAAAWLAAAALAVSALLARLLATWLGGSLSVMAGAARRYGQGRLEARVPHGGAPELAALAQALNEMAAKLDARMRDVMARRGEQDAVFASMMEGVLAVDTRCNVINLNRMAAELFGVDLPGARGRNLLEIVRNPDLLRFVNDTLASPAPTEREIELHDPAERVLNAHGTSLLDAERRRMGALVVLNDVTRLRRLEGMRREFVANVSHELKTPITSIKGFVETLLDGAMRESETAERFLKIIARQADRLSGIIEDLLHLSRIERETERDAVTLEPRNLAEVLRGAVEICQPQAKTRGILIELDCPKEHILPLNAALLESAVVNLIDNAVKYSPDKGRVRVSVREDEQGVAVAVRDWGRGIAPSHLPRLFERFYRVDPSRDRQAGGSGLGLAIVKHIAQAHGGYVDVDSKVDEGSTFYLHLPAAAALASVTPPRC